MEIGLSTWRLFYIHGDRLIYTENGLHTWRLVYIHGDFLHTLRLVYIHGYWFSYIESGLRIG